MKELTPEQLEIIKRPLPKEAVSQHPTKKHMSTIKAIFITERFNEVFGVGKWSVETDLISIGENGNPLAIKTYNTSTSRDRTEFFALSKTKLTIAEYGIYYECIAGASNDDAGDATKGAITDSLSKIASWIGIGMDVFKGQQDQAVREYEKAQAQAAAPPPLSPEQTSVMEAALGQLQSCNSVAEVKTLYDSMPEFVQTNLRFRRELNVRHGLVKSNE